MRTSQEGIGHLGLQPEANKLKSSKKTAQKSKEPERNKVCMPDLYIRENIKL